AGLSHYLVLDAHRPAFALRRHAAGAAPASQTTALVAGAAGGQFGSCGWPWLGCHSPAGLAPTGASCWSGSLAASGDRITHRRIALLCRGAGLAALARAHIPGAGN